MYHQHDSVMKLVDEKMIVDLVIIARTYAIRDRDCSKGCIVWIVTFCDHTLSHWNVD